VIRGIVLESCFLSFSRKFEGDSIRLMEGIDGSSSELDEMYDGW